MDTEILYKSPHVYPITIKRDRIEYYYWGFFLNPKRVEVSFSEIAKIGCKFVFFGDDDTGLTPIVQIYLKDKKAPHRLYGRWDNQTDVTDLFSYLTENLSDTLNIVTSSEDIAKQYTILSKNRKFVFKYMIFLLSVIFFIIFVTICTPKKFHYDYEEIKADHPEITKLWLQGNRNNLCPRAHSLLFKTENRDLFINIETCKIFWFQFDTSIEALNYEQANKIWDLDFFTDESK